MSYKKALSLLGAATLVAALAFFSLVLVWFGL